MTRSEITALVAGVDGWLSPRESEALFRCASRSRGRGVIVEIGSWKGRSTIVLAAGSNAGPRAPVHAVDPHEGGPAVGGEPTLAQFLANVATSGVADLVHPHVQSSAAAARHFDLPVELLYIDGAHDFASVLADFTQWCPKLLDGGVIAFHDTLSYPGPRRVVRDHVYRSRAFRHVRVADSLTYAQKTSRATVLERCANELRWWLNQAYAAAYFIATRPRVSALRHGVRRRLGRSPAGPVPPRAFPG